MTATSTPQPCPACGMPLPPDAPQGECPRCLLQAGYDSQSVHATRSYAPHSSFVPPTVAELQGRFPQYEILELIGQGGMGAVYKAKQAGLGRLVAIKILPLEISQAAFTERFSREARALALLSHPRIVAVHDFGQADGLCYFVMEFVDGVNLRQAIQAGKMNPAEALAIIPQICEALQFAHDEGVVHRDIKPENILIDKRGRVKIADFGLAKLLRLEPADQALTGTQQVMGTLRYMAPEQMLGSREVDHRADIFSLGVVFYELLTGELPIGRFAVPSKKASIDARLDAVVLRALESEPELRYQNASEVSAQLESIRNAPQPLKEVPAEPKPAMHTTPHTPARLSQTALWGAILAPLFLLTVLMFGVSLVPVQTSGPGVAPGAGWGWIHYLVMIPLVIVGLVGACAPFATTLMGVISIGQIRRSAGRLYGMPLAVFDALLFPLLLLDAVLLGLGFVSLLVGLKTIVRGLSPRADFNDLWPLLLTVLLLGPLVLLLDFYLIRMTWRASTSNMPTPVPMKDPPPFQPEPQSHQRTTSTLLIVVVVLAVCSIPVVLCGGLLATFFFSESRPSKQGYEENNQAQPLMMQERGMDHEPFDKDSPAAEGR